MKTITLKYIRDYFHRYCGGRKTDESKSSFLNHLQEKAYFSKLYNKRVFAFDTMHTPEELEKMLVIADDNYKTL